MDGAFLSSVTLLIGILMEWGGVLRDMICRSLLFVDGIFESHDGHFSI